MGPALPGSKSLPEIAHRLTVMGLTRSQDCSQNIFESGGISCPCENAALISSSSIFVSSRRSCRPQYLSGFQPLNASSIGKVDATSISVVPVVQSTGYVQYPLIDAAFVFV